MDIKTLHQDEALRREYFPVAKESIFLANASVCILPQPIVTAMQDYLQVCMAINQEDGTPAKLFKETRQLSARLLGCEAEDIALVAPTSTALSLVANGLDFQPGQNVVYCPDDYPSNAVIWMNLEKRGVELRPVVPEQLGHVGIADLERHVDKQTALVALSSAHFISGYRLDVTAIGTWLREREVLFCLDAIQTVGALDTPAAYVDFMAADAHKWLLGPSASGVFYVSPRIRNQLEPTLLGWNNVYCPGFLTPEKVTFPSSAHRYEAGSANIVGLVGLHAGLKLLFEIGLQAIEETVLQHTRFIRQKLKAKGYMLAGSDDERLSGITSFCKDGIDIPAIHRNLIENNIITSLRQTRDKHYWLRLSPHYYNTVEELDRVLERIG